MNSIVISPYTGPSENDDAHHPLILDVLPGVAWQDITGRPWTGSIPATNMLVIEAELSGQQVSALKNDNRFFVLKPGPGNKGSALTNWLTDQGATGHGVTESDDEAAAIAKLRSFCKGL